MGVSHGGSFGDMKAGYDTGAVTGDQKTVGWGDLPPAPGPSPRLNVANASFGIMI
jgi:hypothetical protein